MKSTSPTRKKVDKLSAEIQQLEAQIAEKKEKLASLKEAKLEAENTEIISIIRNADLSVEDSGDDLGLDFCKEIAIRYGKVTANE